MCSGASLTRPAEHGNCQWRVCLRHIAAAQLNAVCREAWGYAKSTYRAVLSGVDAQHKCPCKDTVDDLLVGQRPARSFQRSVHWASQLRCRLRQHRMKQGQDVLKHRVADGEDDLG